MNRNDDVPIFRKFLDMYNKISNALESGDESTARMYSNKIDDIICFMMCPSIESECTGMLKKLYKKHKFSR